MPTCRNPSRYETLWTSPQPRWHRKSNLDLQHEPKRFHVTGEIFHMMTLRPLQVELEENSVFIEWAWPLNAWFLVCRMPLNTGASSHVLLDPRRLWLASRFWPKNTANPRQNEVQLFFANLKRKANEEKAAELAHNAAIYAIKARVSETQAKLNEERADEYAKEQKLSVKWVWSWVSLLPEAFRNG